MCESKLQAPHKQAEVRPAAVSARLSGDFVFRVQDLGDFVNFPKRWAHKVLKQRRDPHSRLRVQDVDLAFAASVDCPGEVWDWGCVTNKDPGLKP